ncbi:MAG: leucine-rich repeat protein, partial [Clostridia bacterium]|nr:leucine-rich repeat protein [Clostridia bacterium]
MKKLFLTLALILALVFAVTACNGNGGGDTPQGGSTDPDHTHVFDQKNTDKEYLKSKATRDEPAYYYYSCTCGARGTEVFVHGDSKENTLEPVFTLTDDSSFYTVTGLTGKGGVLEIPHMHDGLRVIAISANTFEGNTSIRKVVLPNTIELIGANAFKNCTELMEVELPDGSLATVDSYAFAGCTSLTSIDMPRKLKSLAEGAFQGCTALKSVTLSPGIETVGNLAFDGCIALEIIVLPDTVTTLGNMSFRHAEALASVQFSKSLTTIGNAAFQYCKSLTAVELHEGISVLGNSAFSYCTALKDLKIFGSITNFGNSSFYECTALESIYIAQSTPATVPAKNYIFYNAGTAGKGITFSYGCGTVLPTLLFVPNAEDNLPKITTRTVKHEYVYASNGTHHWQECIALGCGNKSTQEAHDFSGWVVDIPATCNATGIKHKACTVCEKTTGAEVTIPVDQSAHSYLLLSDDTYHWYKCQNAGCTSTKEKAIHVWNTEDLCATCFDHKDKGLVFLKQGDSYTVTKYTGTASKVIIPATYKGGTVTTIGAGAFADCKTLTSITIPSTVTFVGAGAFDGCTSLKYAEYGNACYLGNTENPHHFLVRVKDT